ncbi:MAG: hypothetical protein QOF17_8 [Solirubrobacteraceae bacterium]|nr:hypothetical protein [Solirubrobacteraceae bacterium]
MRDAARYNIPSMARLVLAAATAALLAWPAAAAAAAPATTSLRPVADTAVSAASPHRAAGRDRLLRLGTGRRDRAYLRFVMPRLDRGVEGATLRLWAHRAHASGIDVLVLARGTRWSESRLRYGSAPRGGRRVGRVARVPRGRLAIPLDLARLHLAAGQPVHLALVARRCAAARCHGRRVLLWSREAPARSPRLQLRLAALPAPAPPDTTPPGVTVSAPAAGGSTDGLPTFSGTAEPQPGGGQATVRVQAAGVAAPAQTLSVPVRGDGAWSVRAAGLLAPGDYTVTASERDAAGNLGTSPAVGFTVIPTIAAAGDIACPPGTPTTAAACQHQATSDLLVDRGYHRILALGDNQYNKGTLTEFTGAFDPTWGRMKPLISPVAGNHEYQTAGAQGYFDYFNGVGQSTGPAAPLGDPWYEFTLGSWHIIALDSDCAEARVGGCGTGSAQEAWLRASLAASTAACTLVYWHHPLYTTGNGDGDGLPMATIWQDLAGAGAELVLNGHSHSYQRYAPLDGAGALDAGGVQEIVVGTGGDNLTPTPVTDPKVVVRSSSSFGVLRLSLRPGGYDWTFVPAAGGTFTDSGSRDCH